MLYSEYRSVGPGFALLQRASLLVNLIYDSNSMSMDVLDAVWFKRAELPFAGTPLSDRWRPHFWLLVAWIH